MLPITADGFWAILFSIPLPLALISAPTGQAAKANNEHAIPAIESKLNVPPVSAIELANIAGADRNNTQARGEMKLLDASSLTPTFDAARFSNDEPACDDRSGFVGARACATASRIDDRYRFARRRSERFTTFRSQAPPSAPDMIFDEKSIDLQAPFAFGPSNQSSPARALSGARPATLAPLFPKARLGAYNAFSSVLHRSHPFAAPAHVPKDASRRTRCRPSRDPPTLGRA